MKCCDCIRRLTYNDKRYPAYKSNVKGYRCECCYYKYREKLYALIKDKEIRVK